MLHTSSLMGASAAILIGLAFTQLDGTGGPGAEKWFVAFPIAAALSILATVLSVVACVRKPKPRPYWHAVLVSLPAFAVGLIFGGIWLLAKLIGPHGIGF